MRPAILLCAFLMATATAPQASECTVRSGPGTAALVELYTSEGCDSSPPADRWLSTFAEKSGQSRYSVVPIAFHVDYWDYLGWRDPFGDARYSNRQRTSARASGARTVYTPQVMIDGRDFPAWRSGGAPKAFEAVNARAARAYLGITRSGRSAKVSARLAADGKRGGATLFVAITESNLSTKVSAGENRGKLLRHEFVVRELHAFRNWTGDSMDATIDIAPPLAARLGELAVVAFVQDALTGEVLQALSAPGSCY